MNIYLQILLYLLKYINTKLINNRSNQPKSNLNFLNITKFGNQLNINLNIDAFENLNLTPDTSAEYLTNTIEVIRMAIVRAEAEAHEQRNAELRQEYEKGGK